MTNSSRWVIQNLPLGFCICQLILLWGALSPVIRYLQLNSFIWNIYKLHKIVGFHKFFSNILALLICPPQTSSLLPSYPSPHLSICPHYFFLPLLTIWLYICILYMCACSCIRVCICTLVCTCVLISWNHPLVKGTRSAFILTLSRIEHTYTHMWSR